MPSPGLPRRWPAASGRSIYQALVADHPLDERYQFGLAEVENILALLHRDDRRPAEALTYYERARDRLQSLVHDHPATIAYQGQLALVLTNLGVLRALPAELRRRSRATSKPSPPCKGWSATSRES